MRLNKEHNSAQQYESFAENILKKHWTRLQIADETNSHTSFLTSYCQYPVVQKFKNDKNANQLTA